MVNSRSRCEKIKENLSNPNAQQMNDDGQTRNKYEQCREERIKENLERMQKLGIFDISKALNKPTPKSRKTPFNNRTTPPNSSPLPLPPGPVRRSSRLQKGTPVSYSEAYLTKKDKSLESLDDLLREEGSRPEIYTEEHEKLLGSTEMNWTFFVDGFGKDGKRIYDPVKGKTCHQCRQKTLGHRTHCSECNMVQGQFCGDCLYMRYGEHVIEANQNPNWICPVCRGICNCSLCRQAKGWPPTGVLYRKISSLGYKSVAHYLIQTRRQKTETEADSNSKVPVSAKRSLPFEHVEVTSTEMVLMNSNADPQVPENPQPVSANAEILHCDKQEGKMHISENEEADFKQEEKTPSPHNEQGDCKLDLQTKLVFPSHDLKETLQIVLEIDDSNREFNGKKEDKTYMDNSGTGCILAPESSPMSSGKRVQTIEPADDSIARRLRSRRPMENEPEEHIPGVKQDLNAIFPQHKSAEADANYSNSSDKADADISSPAARTRSLKSKKNRNHASEPSPDSIASRLGRRRAGDI